MPNLPMNLHTVYPSASAPTQKPLQEHLPVASDTLLSKRSPKTLFALVLCQVAALCLASPSFALTIDSVAPKDGKVTVKWSGGTAPYQLEKSTDMVNWEPVDTETSSTALTSIQTSKNGFYRVRNGSSGGGASGGNKLDTTAPSVPTGVTAANNSCSQVTVSWTASTDSGRTATGVKGYYVYRDGAFLRSVLAPATLTSDVGLSGSTTYTYTVRAYDGATNFSGYSTAVTTTTPVCVDTTPPSVPSGVAAASSSCSQVDITWSPSTDNTGGSGLQSYSVYRNNAFWKQVLAPATSTSDTGLAAGVTMNYTVMAIDKAGNQSALSPAAIATTPACPDATAPSIPTGLLVTATSCSQINLSWAASTDNTGGTGIGSYYIYRDGAYLKGVTGTSTTDAGLAASTSHSYAVTAIDNAGNQSAKCTAVSATTPGCGDITAPSIPVGLTATAASTNQINLSWSASLDNSGGSGLSGYYIYRNNTYVGFSATTSYLSGGLSSGVQYCFTITAIDNAGNQSGFSAQACATTQTAPTCTYSLTSSSASVVAAGGTSSVTVNAGAGCTWTPSSNAGWLTCTPATGTGTGTMTWTAAANTGTASRTGTITVQGQTFTVTQAGAACTYTLSSSSASVVATGGSGSVNVTAGTGCAWSASSSDTTWLTITGASGNGSGSVSYSVAANSGTASRTATLTIGGQVFTVTQAGASCSYTLSSSTASVVAAGGTSYFTVNAGTGCAWTATSSAGWLGCTANGTGTANVSWTAAANTATSSRTATITIQGQTFTVTQAAAATCTFTLSANSASIGSIATIGSVNVTAGSGCGWTAVSGSSWISITAGFTGSGNGTVTYSALANLSGARSGTLTIAGQTFAVNQGAAAGDTTPPTVSLSSPTAGSTVSGTVNIMASASDNVGVAHVDFYCDGTMLLGSVTTAPFTFPCDTTTIANGSRTFHCMAYDAAGNSSSSPAVSVTVNNTTAPATGNCVWSHRFGGTTANDNATSTGVAVDPRDSSSVVAGWFMGSADFGKGSVTSAGWHDIFIAKYSSAGVASWQKRIGGTYLDKALGVAIDPRSGDIAVVGYFTSTAVDFGGGVISNPLQTSQAFVVKYAADGTFKWVRNFTTASSALGVAIDPTSGAVLAVGFFRGSIDFAPGLLVGPGNEDSFLAKFDGTTGATTWVKSVSSAADDELDAVAVDGAGNIVVTGWTTGSLNLTGTPITSAGNDDILLAKYNSAGTCLWAKLFGDAAQQWPVSLAVDGSGNIALAGAFDGSIRFAPLAAMSNVGGLDSFVVKLDPSGNGVWQNQVGSTSTSVNSSVASVALDQAGNVLFTGQITSGMDFGNFVAGTPNSGYDIIVGKYSTAGSLLWLKRTLGDAGGDQGQAITVKPNGDALLTGFFYSSADFGCGALSNPVYMTAGFLTELAP